MEEPAKQRKKILITSALPYVNNVPHLGNIIGCVLSADVFARYCRSKGYETLFICGTDEYGTATEIKALEEGVSPKELCDKYYQMHKRIYEWFGISTDIFGRTTTPLHTEITHEIFLALHKNGFIVEGEMLQAYDEKAKMFLADRYVEGTCPHCGYNEARADQCDKCGKLLNFDELINPVSKISKTAPVKKASKHLFINLPKIENELSAWIEKASKEGFWSENSYRIAKAWISEGLKRRCITRDLKWGVPIPLPGWESKVFYVWFDAPIGYISITANHTRNWRDWWQNPNGVELYQFMGKDNVPFHTVIFPSTLIGTRQGWTLLHHISTTEFLNYEGGKFSKSRGVGVFGNDAMETGIPADVWRYYLLTNRPEKTDTNFTWSDFGEKLNNELLANIGNLVNRVMVFSERMFASKVPNPSLEEEDNSFLKSQSCLFLQAERHLERVHIKDALHTCMQAGKEANAYFQKNAPWKAIKENPARCQTSIFVLLNQVKDLAIALEPFLPHTSASIFKQLNMPPRKWEDIGKLSLQPGHLLGKPEILFRKIEPKQLQELAARFGGLSQPSASKEGAGLGFDLDLEIGRIIDVKKHPNAEKLYIEKVEMGGGEIRQIVSGLVPFYRQEELVGQNVIIVKNLKPAVLRGAESRGMLLAAEDDEGRVEVIFVPGSTPGEKLEIEGSSPTRQPSQQITLEQFSSLKLEVKGKIFHANGKMVLAGGSPVKTRTISDGKVR
ncbi:MAG: methionine--tRNA ligase [Candidatus Micrarchaeota archaeon]|nr:methionine--tRNA ligase [Candidatus Micrarchaeota archaeon]